MPLGWGTSPQVPPIIIEEEPPQFPPAQIIFFCVSVLGVPGPRPPHLVLSDRKFPRNLLIKCGAWDLYKVISSSKPSGKPRILCQGGD